MLHNNDCIVEYNSKLCIKTAQMYTKVHVTMYIMFALCLHSRAAHCDVIEE